MIGVLQILGLVLMVLVIVAGFLRPDLVSRFIKWLIRL